MMLSAEYSAGFFDGEGSVYAANRRSRTVEKRPSPCVIVCISNTHKGVLDELSQSWGGSVHCRRHQSARPNCRIQWQWVLSAKTAYPFLLAIYPHLIVKKEVARLAIRLCECMRRPANERLEYIVDVRVDGTKYTYPKVRSEVEEETWQLHDEIRLLNRRGAPRNARRKYSSMAASVAKAAICDVLEISDGLDSSKG